MGMSALKSRYGCEKKEATLKSASLRLKKKYKVLD